MLYYGARKFEKFLEGSNHHLIAFEVDVHELDDNAWVLIQHPMVWPSKADIWSGYPDRKNPRSVKWVGYRWADFVPTWTVSPSDFVIELRR